MATTILFSPSQPPPALEVARALVPAGFELAVADPGTPEFYRAAEEAEYYLGLAHRMGGECFRAAPKLRLVQLLSAGYDRVDVEAARKAGVPVATNGGANSVAVAEHTIMLILATYRRLLHYANYTRAGNWRPSQDRRIDVFEFEGKTLGLVGIGNIAQKVAHRAQAFDANLQYYDKYASLSPTQEETLGIKSVSLEELLRTSDVVSVHVPLTRETRHMIGRAELALMKPTSIIINTARGGIIDEAALLEALQSGAIAGAGLDVLEHEPPDPNDPLPKLDNVIVTPHTAGPTLESFPKRAANGFANILRVWNGEPPRWTAQFEGVE